MNLKPQLLGVEAILSNATAELSMQNPDMGSARRAIDEARNKLPEMAETIDRTGLN